MAIVKKLETPAGQRRRLQLISPADLEPIGEIEALTPEDVKAALVKARAAQQILSQLNLLKSVLLAQVLWALA